MSASLAALGAEVQAFRRSFVAKHGRKPELNDLRAHPRAYKVYVQYARAKATASASTVCVAFGVLCLSPLLLTASNGVVPLPDIDLWYH